MPNSDAVPSRRRFLVRASATATLAAAGALFDARAQSPQTGTLSIGLLRAPASGIIDLTEQHGWFK